MNILIVDGNEKEASERYTKMGMDTPVSYTHLTLPTICSV